MRRESQLRKWERRGGTAFAATDQDSRVGKELQGTRALKTEYNLGVQLCSQREPKIIVDGQEF